MYLILEGSDAVGKTTLIEYLQEKLGWKVLRGSSFELSQCTHQELLQKFTQMIFDNKKEDIIFDRFIYSNAVYASLYNDYAILSSSERFSLEQCYPKGSTIIYLYADYDTIKERLESRGDDYVKSNKIKPILKKYNEVLLQTSDAVKLISFDTGTMSTEEIGDYIINNIVKENENQ